MNDAKIQIRCIRVENPHGLNVMFGMSHFIKTVEDVHEALVSAVPGIEFGFAFVEASGERLIRRTGTNKDMIRLAVQNAKNVGCGHTFFLFLKNAYPINVLPALRTVPEIVTFHAATANPLEIIIAESAQGKGVLGVIDGGSPLGVESASKEKERKAFLRKIGYKIQS